MLKKLFQVLFCNVNKKSENDTLIISVDRLTYQLEKRNSPWWNLFLGIISGFGVFIGGVILVAVLIFILSKLNTVPVIGDYISKIVNVVDQRRN
ncbi:MAG: DUF5665 domain-containing protein [Patescibacteria group bacterium]